ncbi:hypothetical protein AAMO2058_000974300 [Amorphochlora amoebiformis]
MAKRVMSRFGFLRVGVGVAFVTYCAQTVNRWLNTKSPTLKLKDKKKITLLPHEKSSFFNDGISGISTITFYDGEAPLDYLKQRVDDIIKANPWLSGRISDSPERIIAYDEKPHPESFSEFGPESIQINLNTSVREFKDALAPALVGDQKDIRNMDEPSFRVSVVRDYENPESKFALVVSLNPILGDGHTYYKVYRMLGRNHKIESLNPERKPEAYAAMDKMLGEEEKFLSTRPMHAFNFFAFLSKSFINTKTEVRVFQANKEYMERLGGHETSSQNLIASELIRALAPTLGMIVLNSRDYITSLHDKDAGNYENFLFTTKNDYKSPEDVSNIISTARRPDSSPLPSFMEMISGTVGRVAWFGIGEDEIGVDLEGCTERCHLPIVDFSDVFDRSQNAIIFRPRQNELGVMMYGSPGIYEKLKGQTTESIVGEVYEDINVEAPSLR